MLNYYPNYSTRRLYFRAVETPYFTGNVFYQRSGVQVSERIALFYIIGAQLRNPHETPQTTHRYGIEGFEGSVNWDCNMTRSVSQAGGMFMLTVASLVN